MKWQEKMIIGMKLIIEACETNESWYNCRYCPLNNICDDNNDARRARNEDFESLADILASEIKIFESKKK